MGTKCVVILPTRELASQCYEVILQLTSVILFSTLQATNIRSELIIGGNNDLNSQKIVLNRKPDILVCTTGILTYISKEGCWIICRTLKDLI